MTDSKELAAIRARDAATHELWTLQGEGSLESIRAAIKDRDWLLEMLRDAMAQRDALRAENERLRESLLNISTVEITDYLPAARALTYCREVAKAALSHGQPPSDTP